MAVFFFVWRCCLFVCLVGGVLCRPDWNYGIKGPTTWTGICQSGRQQSPINIDPSEVLVDHTLPPIIFHMYDSQQPWELSSVGHFVFGHPPNMSGSTQTHFGQTEYGISGGGLDGFYPLLQFHFHWGDENFVGSEHTLSRNHFSIEAHLVHIKKGLTMEQAMNTTDGLAVVAVWFQVTSDEEREEAKRHKPVKKLSKHLKDVKEVDRVHEDAWKSADLVESAGLNKINVPDFHLGDILPIDRSSWYRYNGSLTTPDCNEVVVWTIMAHPVIITQHEMDQFRELAIGNSDPMTEIGADKNWRPTQPMNGRKVTLRSLLARAHPDGTPLRSSGEAVTLNAILAIIGALLVLL